MKNLLTIDIIKEKIRTIRGQKVLMDSDLAEMYGVETRVFNQAVKRNIDRFPPDFMFQLEEDEYERLRSQFVTSKRGGRRYMPYVFTEQGVAMLSSVLNSKQAIEVNIAVMRAFVQMRELFSQNRELIDRLSELEERIERHDDEIAVIFDAIHQLMEPPEETKGRIGFRSDPE